MKCNYKIKNIDCINCAKKIEDYLNKDDNINDVSINYSTLNIKYTTNIKNSINYVNKRIKEIEPNTYIYDKELKFNFNIRFCYSHYWNIYKSSISYKLYINYSRIYFTFKKNRSISF